MNSNLNRNDAAVIIRISKISKIRNLSGPRNRSAPKIYYYFKECDNFESVRYLLNLNLHSLMNFDILIPKAFYSMTSY